MPGSWWRTSISGNPTRSSTRPVAGPPRLAPRLRSVRVSRESSQIPSLKSAAKARGHFTPTQARTRPCSNEIRRSLNGRFRKVLTTRAQATPRVSLSHRRVARIQCLINICHLRSVSPHRHALHAWVPPSPRARCRKVFVTYLLDSYLRSEFLTSPLDTWVVAPCAPSWQQLISCYGAPHTYRQPTLHESALVVST